MAEVRFDAALFCPACGHLERSLPRAIRDRYDKAWTLLRCSACGIAFQRDPMSDEERAQFYGSGEYRRLCEQVTGKPWTDASYLKDKQREYAWTWHSEGKPELRYGTWLDYGGSTGVVSQAWGEHYVKAIVADYGDGATHTPEQAWDLGPYDAILCCQTLDHLREPLVTLKKFREVAKDGARLFVDVVKKAHTQYKIDHDVYFPTAQSFVGLVERAGWSILWLDCETNPTHYSILAEKV